MSNQPVSIAGPGHGNRVDHALVSQATRAMASNNMHADAGDVDRVLAKKATLLKTMAGIDAGIARAKMLAIQGNSSAARSRLELGAKKQKIMAELSAVNLELRELRPRDLRPAAVDVASAVNALTQEVERLTARVAELERDRSERGIR